MKAVGIKGLLQRHPFRPFAIRLSNGAQYTFRESRDLGATKDCHILVFFGKSEAVRIDSNSIVEIIERQ